MPSVETHPTTRWAIAFLGLIGVVWVLIAGRYLMVPVVISLMLATAVWPVFAYLQEYWKLPRTLSALSVVGGMVFVAGVFLALGGLALLEIIVQLPPPQSWFMPPPAPLVSDDTSATAPPLTRPESPYERVHARVAELNRELADQIFPADYTLSPLYVYVAPFVEARSREVPYYIATVTEQIIFILVLVLFLLIEGEMLMRRTAEIFGPSTGENSRAAIMALHKMAKGVRSYLVWRTVLNIGLALVLGVIYKYMLGMSYPWVWAILCGVLTYVPYVGPIMAAMPAVADALFSPAGGIWSALAVIVLYSIILFMEGYVVFPLVIGRNMEMNATTVLLGCLFWWLVWGVVGLFLAMPLMGAMRAIFLSVPEWVPWANLMGMEPHVAQRAGRIRRWLRGITDRLNGRNGRPQPTAGSSVDGQEPGQGEAAKQEESP